MRSTPGAQHQSAECSIASCVGRVVGELAVTAAPFFEQQISVVGKPQRGGEGKVPGGTSTRTRMGHMVQGQPGKNGQRGTRFQEIWPLYFDGQVQARQERKHELRRSTRRQACDKRKRVEEIRKEATWLHALPMPTWQALELFLLCYFT